MQIAHELGTTVFRSDIFHINLDIAKIMGLKTIQYTNVEDLKEQI